MPMYSMLNMSSPKFDPVTSQSPQMMNSASSSNSGAHHSSLSSSPGTQLPMYTSNAAAFAPVSIAYNPNSPSYVSSLNTPTGNLTNIKDGNGTLPP